MVANLENWQSVVTPYYRKIFGEEFKKLPRKRHLLYNIESSDTPTEIDYTTAGPKKFEKFLGVLASTDINEGYSKTYTHDEFSQSVSIQYKLYQDDKKGQVKKKIRGLSEAANYKMEEDAFDEFVHAFDTTYVGADSLQLCSNAHTSFVSGSPNQDNLFTYAFNYTNWIAVRRLMRAYKDYNNEKMHVEPNIFLGPTDLEDEAITVFYSKSKPGGADNDINAILKMGAPKKKVITTEWLSDAKDWWAIDERLMMDHHNFFIREKLKNFRDQSSSTLNLQFAGYCRYSHGHTGWQWCAGNQVT